MDAKCAKPLTMPRVFPNSLARLELPIDHFRLLGVSPSAGTEEVLRAFQLRLDRPPQKGLTNELLAQRAELLRLSADLLSDKRQRQEYEIALLEGASGLELSSNREVAGLLLLWEAKASYQAFKRARKALQPPQAPALGSGRESDLTIVAALSCRDAAIEEQLQRRYSSSAELLQEGIQLLQRMGKLSEERKTLENDLELLLPYRILDLLSREEKDEISHEEGIRLLDGFILQRGGIEGKRIVSGTNLVGGLSQQDFELFFQQIRRFLTAKEQADLYINWYKRGSSESGFLAVIALVAAGFEYKEPDLLSQARKYLKNLNIQGLDSMPLIGCIDLLLADVQQSEARFKSSSDIVLKDWIANYPGESLEAICYYCCNWLTNDVLPGYRDIEPRRVDLDNWFSLNEVQEYVEQLDNRGALGIAKAGFSMLSTFSNDKIQTKDNYKLTLEEEEREGSLAMPGGVIQGERYQNKTKKYLNDFVGKVLSSNFWERVKQYEFVRFNTALSKDVRNYLLSNPVALGASVFTTLFVVGTGIGIIATRKPFDSVVVEKTDQKINSSKNKEFKTDKSNIDLSEIKINQNREDKYILLTDEEPNLEAIRNLLEAWFDSKSRILAGYPDESLRLVVRPSLYKRVFNERTKDLALNQRQIISAVINKLEIRARTTNRIVAYTELSYKDKKMDANGKILSETVIPSLKVKYIIGRNKGSWKLVDYISGI